MKKILIVLKTIILCLVLVSCSKEKDEILYKDEIIDLIYSSDFEKWSAFQYDWSGEISRPDTVNIFDISRIDYSDAKFYEATIVEKKVIAGFYDEKTIDKIHKLCQEYCGDLENYQFPYVIDSTGFSDIYIDLLMCSDKNIPNFNLKNFDVELCVFENGIPITHNNKKLAFVLRYYGIKLNDGRKIVAIEYCTGDVINDCFYPLVRNSGKCESLNYGNYIYIDMKYTNVVDYKYFSYYIIPEDDKLEYDMHIISKVYKEETLSLFNQFKNALRNDSPSKDYDHSGIYYYDYQKLKDILVK